MEKKPSSTDLPFYSFASTPIIVVGRITAYAHVGWPHRERWDGYGKPDVQLGRVTIKVENVLRGDVAGEIAVYYFTYAGSMGSSPLLGMWNKGGTWHIGDREMFFLRRDAGVLRTICDCLQYCVVPVFSGAHPGFKPNPREPLSHAIVDLLLTRGDGSTDQQMEDAISKSGAEAFSETYALEKLQQLAGNETPPVRKQACQLLAGYKHPCAASPPEKAASGSGRSGRHL